MGCDPLEIIFRIEKRFGIDVRDDARSAFQTAGTLYEYVWQRLQGILPGVPDSSVLSKQIDEALPTATGRRWWFQSASFEARFENGDIEDNWRRFQRTLRVSLPPLVLCEETSKVRLPRGFRTHASVILWMLQNHPERVTWLREPLETDRPPGAEKITRDECWVRVRAILADVLVLDPNQILPESHLIEDLGME
jgi:acyl carrier protein